MDLFLVNSERNTQGFSLQALLSCEGRAVSRALESGERRKSKNTNFFLILEAYTENIQIFDGIFEYTTKYSKKICDL